MLPQHAWRLNLAFRALRQQRLYRTSGFIYDRSRPYERVTIPCRGNGSITLDIYNPHLVPKTKLRSIKPPALVITLPGSASIGDDGPHEIFSSTLAELSSLPVVQLNYRRPPEHRFPKPLHDALTGYDWIVKNLLPAPPPIESPSLQQSRGSSSPNQPQADSIPSTIPQSRIGLFGSHHISGSLALAIGLTECRTATSPATLSSYPARIAAVATRNAIPDWLAPHQPLSAPPPGDPSNTTADSDNFNQTRSERAHLLASSRDYFHTHRQTDILDPFASPTYFFRTPSIDALPSAISSDSNRTRMDAHGRSKSEPWMNLMVQPAITGLDFFSAEFRNRSYARRYPPVSMEPVVLPDLLLCAEEGGEVWAQNELLGRMVRRAMARQVMPAKVGERSRELNEEEMDEGMVKKERKREIKERGEELKVMMEKMHERVTIEGIVNEKGDDQDGAEMNTEVEMSRDEIQKLADFFSNKLTTPD